MGFGLDEWIRVDTMDDPDKKGDHHRYDINLRVNDTWGKALSIKFHTGALPDPPMTAANPGPNGISMESLLAVVIDRLQCLQKGPTACRENSIAITYLENSLMWMQKRTRDRIAQGTFNPDRKVV